MDDNADKLVIAISEMDEATALRLSKEMLADGTDPMEVLRLCRVAMDIVGERFEKEEYFLPELMMAGDMLEQIGVLIKPLLMGAADGDGPKTHATIVLGTVHGDLHDIGKNIVGVVLRCNNFEVIDLGVMVPTQKILDTAKAKQADIIGLSGLITPSLEEMGQVAKEMQRQGLQVPLLIGGATTSRAHTALKIEPHYEAGTVWVKDASRAVGVAQSLVSKERVKDFLAKVRTDYAKVRERYRNRGPGKRLMALPQAREQRFSCDWSNYHPPQPKRPGLSVFNDYDLAKLRDYIDWTPFFQAWELRGHYPAILTDEVVGPQASELFSDAQAMLDKIITEKWLTARAVIGLWPAANSGDDVEVYSDTTRTTRLAILHSLRQQADKPIDRPNFCLADFITPKEFNKPDWIGGFAVTTGLGIEEHLARFQADDDDYSSIILKALADRLAEAFAEHLHERVRTEFWGYAEDEKLDNHALIAEHYRGIRPAPGYPACPDHTEKATLFELLEATANTGIQLTEGFAMYPAAAVSGWYFSHPQSQYFVVGRLSRQQIDDYAQRKKWSVEEAEHWLSPWLDYEPD